MVRYFSGINIKTILIVFPILIVLGGIMANCESEEVEYITTDSGLKYRDIVVGHGKTATTGDTVNVHYVGKLEDGTQFDSSVDRGQPFTFSIGRGMVIQGWDEGVTSMKERGLRELVIPPNLGYGDAGAGDIIPPGATLIFKIELLDIK